MDLSANRQADSEDMDQDEGGPASGESGVLQIMDDREEEEEGEIDTGLAFRENLQEMGEEDAIKPVIIMMREKIAKSYASFFKQQREENEKVKQKEMEEKEQARLDAIFMECVKVNKEEQEEEMQWKKEKEEEEEEKAKEKEKKMINYHTPPRDKRGFARAAP
jgi:hypothetical protein